MGSEIINQLCRNIIGHSLGKTSTPRCAAAQYYVLCLICSLDIQAFRVVYRELADHLPSDCSLPDTQVYLVFHNCSLCFLFTVSTGTAVRRLRAERSLDTQDFRVSLCFHRCDRVNPPITVATDSTRRLRAERLSFA